MAQPSNLSSSKSSTFNLNNPFVAGFLRASLMFIPTHMTERVKIGAQNASHLSTKTIILKIYAQNGYRGFLDGAASNYPRRVLRDTIRWPLIGYSKHLLEKYFPDVFQKDSTTTAVFSGLATASFDSLVIGPLENLMVYRIKEKNKYSEFFKRRFSQQGIASLYRGASLNFAYRTSVWSVCLGTESEIKKKFKFIDESQLYPHTREVTSAVISSTILVSTLLPVDFFKTHIQADPRFHGKKNIYAIKTLYKENGFRRLYSGWAIVWTYNIIAVLIFQKMVELSIAAFQEKSIDAAKS